MKKYMPEAKLQSKNDDINIYYKLSIFCSSWQQYNNNY